MNVNILIPFYRKHLYRTLISYYVRRDVIIHPICDHVDIEPFKDNVLDWVKPFLCPALKPGEQCYTKFNYFIEGSEIIDEDYYGFCGDDDMFEEDISSQIKQKNADVIYISNYRGDKIPNDGSCPHPTYPLIPKRKEDIHLGNVGLGMYFIKGKILKKLKFRTDTGWGDGHFAMDLLNITNSIDFSPNTFVFGNYFQPGRHTDISKFLKPTWELPKTIE